jgi:hypothetical protein
MIIAPTLAVAFKVASGIPPWRKDAPPMHGAVKRPDVTIRTVQHCQLERVVVVAAER